MTLLSGCAVLNNLESYFLLISKSQNYFISIVMIHRSVLKFILVMNLYNFVHVVKMKFSKCVNCFFHCPPFRNFTFSFSTDIDERIDACGIILFPNNHQNDFEILIKLLHIYNI